MSQPENDLAILLRTMQPELHPGAFAFVSLPTDADVSLSETIATLREAEGLTVVVGEEGVVMAPLGMFRMPLGLK